MDGFLISRQGSSLRDVRVDLRVFKGPRKGQVWGEPTEPGHPYFQPLKTLNLRTLSYEIFMELVNKTDWLLRKLVESLERKLDQERKGYQVERARIQVRMKNI